MGKVEDAGTHTGQPQLSSLKGDRKIPPGSPFQPWKGQEGDWEQASQTDVPGTNGAQPT